MLARALTLFSRYCLSIVIVGMLFTPHAGAKDKIIRLTSGEFAPLMSAKTKHRGLISHIVDEAASLSGYRVHYGFFPWKRAYVMAKSGYWDGSVAWGYTAEREKYFVYSAPIFPEQVYLYHRKHYAFDWQEEADLEGIKLGVNRGYLDEYMLQQMQKRGLQINYQTTTTELQNFRALLGGRIDIVISNSLIAERVLRQHFDEQERGNIVHHARPFRVTSLHVLISREIEQTDEYISALNQGLERLHQSGRYDELVSDFKAGAYD
ncbi:ABC transporter substrate-binding protein [Salinivibrio sp. ES.052]|uniref:substrate-binding periplasmic protein n=1 Tax=Salinivibrio sp. ES.052 TaxID=1882823 RepID=UPI00092887DC|nr:transporter substrate-binding domain-containing protein [Salinivibrio sp. ES.052]SIN86838.1 amino acid ABC transporter substrate-binding protein, PAAT family [Salinivibrio sp. ES.052]